MEAWLTSYTTSTGADLAPGDLAEAVATELCPDLVRYESDAALTETVGGLLGSHPRISSRRLTVRVDELLARTKRFRTLDLPGHRAYQRLRSALVTAQRTRLRLDEYRPRVMSTFVRSRLIDEVYLPLIGDNLAKQLGTTGESKRTDTGGMLLLISPPGYGKTTLMEYVAARLGMIMVKVGGPAMGHAVTSLDPAEAPNSTARQEIEKINFALEAGNNTLLFSTTSSTPRPSCCKGSSRCAIPPAASKASGTANPTRTTCAASASRSAWPATPTQSPAAASTSPTCSPTALTCGTWAMS